MGPLSYLFSFEGRIRRTHWWLGGIALALVFMLIYFAIIMSMLTSLPAGMDYSDEAAMKAWAENLIMTAGPIYLIAFGVALLIMMVGQFSLNCRRYHDRNKSGWWCLLGVAPMFFTALSFSTESPALALVAIVGFFVVPVWQLIELGFLGGTAGTNDHGPDPRGGGLGSLAGEIAAMRGPQAQSASGSVWSQKRENTPLYAPAAAASMPAARTGPATFGKRH